MAIKKRAGVLTPSGLIDNPRPTFKDGPKFFIVWNPNGPHNPVATFSHVETARAAAMRLAKAVPGGRFYVCEAQEFYQTTAVSRGVLG
jgi:hypothetical protein